MPQRFDSGVFDPETAKLMRSAYETAWAKVQVAPQDREAATHHLAEAIIELAKAGVTDRERLATKALVALASAKSLSGEWMIRRDQGAA